MKRFVILIFYLNFLIFGGGFLIGFSQFIAYNGFGDIFEYVKPEHIETRIKVDSIAKSITIFYKYIINRKEYESRQSVALSKISKNDFSEDNIYYNKQIPYFSYIGNQYLAQYQAKVAMCVSAIPFLFIFLLYKFADIDKWVGVYTRGEYKSSRKK